MAREARGRAVDKSGRCRGLWRSCLIIVHSLVFCILFCSLQFVNNIIQNITGAGFGSWGCYNW